MIINKVSVFIFLLVFINALAFNNEIEWLKYKLKHKKFYSTVKEDNIRKSIWLRNKLYVENFNKESANKTFKVEINELADRLPKELLAGKNIRLKNLNEISKLNSVIGAPASFDWRKEGVIGPVVDQGVLADVYDIVTAECIESLNAIKTKKLIQLSDAQVADCCGVSELQDPFQCVHKTLGGLCSLGDYPETKGVCDPKSCQIVAPVNGSYMVKSGDEDDLQVALLQAPLFVAVDASQTSFQLYAGGIYSDPNCDPEQLDHVLQLVGYGVLNGVKFWICKNSWGANWGLNGYINIVRGKNMCGIASYALLPL